MSKRPQHSYGRQLAAIGAIVAVWSLGLAALAEDKPKEPAATDAASIAKPKWEVGDKWTIETVSQRIQGREEEPAREAVPIRWQFHVASMEKLAGRDCYRVEVECMAKGRIRPKSVIWCDQETLFPRQFKTQLAVDGKMREMVESYDHAKGEVAPPVITPINALPIIMPAFVPPGSKVNSFTYVSAPMPAGAKSKDLGLVSFAHEVTQTSAPAGSKAIEMLPRSYSKGLEAVPVTEVQIRSFQDKVTQLWQPGQPWPVYVDNGRTKAYLVKDGE